MLALEYAKRFRKDAKRLEKRGKNMRKLYEIIEKLRAKEALSEKTAITG